jgi:hypothetical protein
MDKFTRDELRSLLESGTERFCVSLFLPTHRAGVDIQQDPIRLKNLLRQAEDELTARGLRAAEARDLLQPASTLLNDPVFWRHQADGLAVFVSPKQFRSYRLPLSLEEHVTVNARFHLKPLVPLLSGDGRFYLLALSQGRVRLYQCARDSISEIEWKDMIRSKDEALLYDDLEKSTLIFRSFTVSGRGQPQGGPSPATGMIHGHGGQMRDEDKTQILRFFQLLDRSLHGLFHDETAPLVLAGVEYLFPLYREASTYRHLLDGGIEGNPEGKSHHELHAQAWTLVEPHFRKAQRAAAAKYDELGGTARAVSEIEKIVPAAFDGRVDSLFIATDAELSGSFDPATHRVEVGEAPDGPNEDLLDLAAVATLINGGQVYVVERGTVPGRNDAAAVLRY